MPKVSIILPNYNYAEYLDERIQSLLSQTYKNFELIILDDASTDNSLEVIKKYVADSRVKTKFYSENSGLPYKRWNDGADLAQGQYLLIAGADDSCAPKLLEKLVEKLEQNPTVGLTFSESSMIDSYGKQLIFKVSDCIDQLAPKRWKEDFICSGKTEINYLLFANTIPNASSVLMRREIFEKAGKFDERLILAADWMLWVKILMNSDLAFIAEPLNLFRQHANTVRSKSAKNGIEIDEFCQVKTFILRNSNLDFSREDVLRAFFFLKLQWIEHICKAPFSISLTRNIRIYKALSLVHKKILWELAKTFLLNQVGLKKPYKTLKKLFQKYLGLNR